MDPLLITQGASAGGPNDHLAAFIRASFFFFFFFFFAVFYYFFFLLMQKNTVISWTKDLLSFNFFF